MNHKKELLITLFCLLIFVLFGLAGYHFYLPAAMLVSGIGIVLGLTGLFFQVFDYLNGR